MNTKIAIRSFVISSYDVLKLTYPTWYTSDEFEATHMMTARKKEEVILFIKDPEFKDKISMCLREWLKACRLSIADFARLIGVHRMTVHYWMMGKRVPCNKSMEKVISITKGKVRTVDHLIDPIHR